MSNKNDGGPAFPRTQWTGNENNRDPRDVPGLSLPGNENNRDPRDVPGLSLRDYFAAKAMPIILGDIIETQDIEKAKKVLTIVSLGAYEIADAMLKERDK